MALQSSSSPADECKRVPPHSARALAAHDRQSQCIEGAVERLVRPMLARSLTEKVQAVVCTDNHYGSSHPTLSSQPYAVWALQRVKSRDYRRLAGLKSIADVTLAEANRLRQELPAPPAFATFDWVIDRAYNADVDLEREWYFVDLVCESKVPEHLYSIFRTTAGATSVLLLVLVNMQGMCSNGLVESTIDSHRRRGTRDT